ncbi:hypothetical protein J602_1352 [Acinetobacter baumannii 1417041]|nr:hypothetical protein J602_1352 [Acinetobacter baumannii 1417041]
MAKPALIACVVHRIDDLEKIGYTNHLAGKVVHRIDDLET